ncbi:MAG TPA: hypothetical protein DCZ95_12610 [Verrucomicrobia bacterium]|nr:hypothetical protein [Verrucomicrobiota bacterium]
MNPTPKSAHKDAALTALAIGYLNPMFIADRVFPHVPVAKRSDYFFKFLKGDWFRLDAQVRGAGAEAAQSGYKLTSDSYSCLEYALAHPVPVQLINNADAALRPWETAVNYVMRQVMLRKEYVVSQKIVTAANWTSTNDAEGNWLATATTNTFIPDMFLAKKTVRELIGIDPNVLVVDANTWDNILQNEDVLDRIKYSSTAGSPAVVTPNLIAQLFGLDEVLVGGAIYSNSEETVAGTEFNAVRMWETNATKGSAWLGYRTALPAINEPNAGYIFEWMGDAGQESEVMSSDVYREVRKWWEDSKKAWMVEASETFDAKITSADAGFLFTDTLAT